METQEEPKIRELSEEKKQVLGDVLHSTDQTQVLTLCFQILLKGVPNALELP